MNISSRFHVHRQNSSDSKEMNCSVSIRNTDYNGLHPSLYARIENMHPTPYLISKNAAIMSVCFMYQVELQVG